MIIFKFSKKYMINAGIDNLNFSEGGILVFRLRRGFSENSPPIKKGEKSEVKILALLRS